MIANSVYIAACNRCGTTGETTFGGCSTLIDPMGKVLWEAKKSPAGAVMEIETELAAKTKEALGVFTMRRPELYGELVLSGK